MSKVVLPLLAVAVIGVSAAAWQSHELSAERERAAAMDAQLKALTAKSADLEKEAARLRDLNNVFQSESEQLRKKLADRGTSKGDATSGTDVGNGFTPLEEEKKDGAPKKDASFMKGIAKMFTDPEMKKAMRGQQAMGMRMMYSDLAKELGLNPKEAEAVMELLTDRQMDMAGKGMAMLDGDTTSPEKIEESGKAANATKDEYDKQISDLIGPDRYSKFQDYEKSLGERFALNQIQQQFTAKGMTLDDAQRKDLLNIMVDERQKAPKSPFDPANRDVAGQMKAMQSDEVVTKLIDQQKQVNARVLNRAAGILSPDQVNAMKESQDQFLQMQEFGIKMSKQMFSK